MPPIDAFFDAVLQHSRGRAEEALRAQPDLPSHSLHVAAVLGLEPEVRRLIESDRAQVHARVGPPAADPLLWLCHSPFHGESAERDEGLAACARALLDAGADPNTKDGHYGVPALYAVTGLNDAPRIARMLLEAGAHATDGESVFHAAERFHLECLELLLEHGVELNDSGDWGNTPLYFLLRHHDVAREPEVEQGMLWLLAHGADPNVRCGRIERESSLHVAARRGQAPRIVQLLLDHGADVRARRDDGRTAWLLAKRGGHEEVAALLEKAGAPTEPLTRADQLMAACGRGDVEGAERLASPALLLSLDPADLRLLPTAAGERRPDVVAACIAAGFPVDTKDDQGATALHHAGIQGNATMARRLLARGADFRVYDPEHRSTPLGWACFGADHVQEPGGDYVGTVRALVEAGARHTPDLHPPEHEGVRAALGRS